MRMRTIATTIAATALVLAGGVIAGAPAASAKPSVDYEVSGCDKFNYTAPAGTVFGVYYDVCTYDFTDLAVFDSNPGATVDDSNPNYLIVTIGSGPGWVEVNATDETDPYLGACGTVNDWWGYDLVNLCPNNAPTPDWVQGYGRASADAACDEGWTASYADWPNDGKGGWVCTRSVPMYGAE